MNCPNCGSYRLDTAGRCLKCGYQPFISSNTNHLNWFPVQASDYSAALIAMTAELKAMTAERDTLKTKLARARQTLEVYADRHNWGVFTMHKAGSLPFWTPPDEGYDQADDALKETK